MPIQNEYLRLMLKAIHAMRQAGDTWQQLESDRYTTVPQSGHNSGHSTMQRAILYLETRACSSNGRRHAVAEQTTLRSRTTIRPQQEQHLLLNKWRTSRERADRLPGTRKPRIHTASPGTEVPAHANSSRVPVGGVRGASSLSED